MTKLFLPLPDDVCNPAFAPLMGLGKTFFGSEIQTTFAQDKTDDLVRYITVGVAAIGAHLYLCVYGSTPRLSLPTEKLCCSLPRISSGVKHVGRHKIRPYGGSTL